MGQKLLGKQLLLCMLLPRHKNKEVSHFLYLISQVECYIYEYQNVHGVLILLNHAQ